MMPQTIQPTRHVFVYGTLRAGGSNDITRYRPTPQRTGSAVAVGTLYDLGLYPGLRLGGTRCVVGEVYLVTVPVEQALDVLESIRPDDQGEYLKKTIELDVGGQRLTCLVYEIHESRIGGCSVIDSGDWLEHVNRRHGSIHPQKRDSIL